MSDSHETFSQNYQAPASTDRSFGFVFAIFFAGVAIYPVISDAEIRFWALGVSAGFLGLAIAAPSVLAYLNRAWAWVGVLLGEIVGPISLGVLFFAVITPIGLLMRLFKKDPLRLKFDLEAPSYWIQRVPPGPSPDSLKQQF